MARGDGIHRTTARNARMKDADIGNAQAHNEREKSSYVNQDIVPERTPYNVHFKTPTVGYKEMFEQMRSDGVIGEYSAVDYNDELLVITDQNDNEAVIIMPKSVLVSPEKSENRFDWISEETLIDSFIESMRVENSYTRDQIRQLKEMAHQLIERGSNVSFTKERISKIQSLMVGISQNEEYAQTMLQFALSDESTKEALVKELVSNHFDQIQNRITEFSAVQERLSELKSQEVSIAC